jgi:hypothetical protein
MAGGEHNVTRRALLGAAAALPLVGCGPGLGEASLRRGSGQALRLRSGQAATGSAAPEVAGERVAVASGSGRSEAAAAAEAWTEALDALGRAERRMEGFARRTSGSARPFAAQCRVDERLSDLACAFNRRVEALMLVPAPDIHAFARKVGLAIDEQVWELPAAAACLAQVKADAAEMAAAYG